MRYCHIILACCAAWLMASCADEATLYGCDAFEVYADSIVARNAIVKALSYSELRFSLPGEETHVESYKVDSRYPIYTSDQLLVDALYYRGLETLDDADAADGGRPLFVGADLAEALLAPQRVMERIGRRVFDAPADPRWPLRGDDFSWVRPAWEAYKATGDSLWLARLGEELERRLAATLEVTLNPGYNLVQGSHAAAVDTLGLFPSWMGETGRYEVMGLRSNVEVASALAIAAQVAAELADTTAAEQWRSMASEIAQALNEHLWMPSRGCYSYMLYGGSIYPLQAMATDNLAQSIAILSSVADAPRARSIFSHVPMLERGVAAFYPLVGDSAQWRSTSFPASVQDYWTAAAAACDNVEEAAAGLASTLRTAAFSPADVDGTSVASLIFRVIFGMRLDPDGLAFNPVVPAGLTGVKSITGLKYRDAELDIIMRGTGTTCASFMLDREQIEGHKIPADLRGQHTVEIVLANNRPSRELPALAKPQFLPRPPKVKWLTAREAEITDYKPTRRYRVYLNDAFREEIDDDTYHLYDARRYTSVAIMAADKQKHGWMSLSAQPHEFVPEGAEVRLPLAGSTEGEAHRLTFHSPSKETYILQVRYSVRPNPEVERRREKLARQRRRGQRNRRHQSAAARTRELVESMRPLSLARVEIEGSTVGWLVMPLPAKADCDWSGASNRILVNMARGANHVRVQLVDNNNIAQPDTVVAAALQYLSLIRKE